MEGIHPAPFFPCLFPALQLTNPVLTIKYYFFETIEKKSEMEHES